MYNIIYVYIYKPTGNMYIYIYIYQQEKCEAVVFFDEEYVFSLDSM